MSSEALSRWFGKSVVVDASGAPLRVYHGTTAAYTRFEYQRWGHYADAIGFWVAEKHGLANNVIAANATLLPNNERTQPEHLAFADGTLIMPVYVSIQRPLPVPRRPLLESVLAISAATSSEHASELLRGLLSGNLRVVAEVRRRLVALGYDGIEIGDDQGFGRSWAAFAGTQIKSATGNRRSYDPADPDIRH
jgi:hypothetical protein